jgi:hypothetical protein
MLSFNSQTSVTPKKHCSFHADIVVVKLKMLHPEFIFSECLQLDYYYCTLCRLTCPKVKITQVHVWKMRMSQYLLIILSPKTLPEHRIDCGISCCTVSLRRVGSLGIRQVFQTVSEGM